MEKIPPCADCNSAVRDDAANQHIGESSFLEPGSALAVSAAGQHTSRAALSSKVRPPEAWEAPHRGELQSSRVIPQACGEQLVGRAAPSPMPGAASSSKAVRIDENHNEMIEICARPTHEKHR